MSESTTVPRLSEAQMAAGSVLTADGERQASLPVARLVRRYIIWSTLFFFVSGLLGMVVRSSQAELTKVDSGFFYALMTAHGLGAFVGWAAFAIMGVSFWVLHEMGFTVRRAGLFFAEVAFVTMVLGVLGVVVTTVLFNFGASWVFLYPLPFFSSGEWSDTTSGVFAASVLLTGVSIIAWCIAILHTIVGPGLKAEGRGVPARLAIALGLGHLATRRLALKGGQPNYAIIPLTVIAIDMIIATIPFAALLVMMIVQSISPSTTVDPLLAKNLLWFFGHPVVYLLLFPAVSVYYWLIPRFAGRPLVAGKVIAVGWLIAVIANVIVWGHHIYVDFPSGSIQGLMNMIHQPLTLAVTIPSAVSLYSLVYTIKGSRFEWTPGSAFLVAGMFGWMIAGLSGVINATVAFDFAIHNTMWIVGHFHQMALMNIGMVIFGAIYVYLPAWSGREWYSRNLGFTHMWMTIVGGYGWTIAWKFTGLYGAPRRFAEMPPVYDIGDDLTLGFLVVLFVGQVAFAWNLYKTMRARSSKETLGWSSSPSLIGWTVGAGALVSVVMAIALLTGRAPEPPAVASAGKSVAGGKDGGVAMAGREPFIATCGGCHKLAAAGTQGTVGPPLDGRALTEARVLGAINKGGTGAGLMPPGLLSGKEAQDVAEFVADVAEK